MHLVDLAQHRLVEEPHQGTDLGTGARPVLRRKRVDREHLHAELLARIEHTFDGSDPGAVAEAGGVAAAAGPAAVAVHDDPHVPGNLGVPTPPTLPVLL